MADKMEETKKEAPYADFGHRLMKLRKDENMTRAQLGEICGVAPSTIVNYERGTRIPYADTAVKMADHFHISVHELLGVDDPELAMAREQSLDGMRAISGKKGADRLKDVYAAAENLAGGDLTDDQLLEFSLQMTKMAQLAQQRLTERYSNKRYQETVRAKREQTAETVKQIDDTIDNLASGNAQ